MNNCFKLQNYKKQIKYRNRERKNPSMPEIAVECIFQNIQIHVRVYNCPIEKKIGTKQENIKEEACHWKLFEVIHD